MGQQVEAAVKDQRLAQLHGLIGEQAGAFNAACVGRSFEVLLDRPGRHPGQLLGRSPYMQSVFVTAPEAMLNSVQRLRITAAYPNSLAAVIDREHGEERACA